MSEPMRLIDQFPTVEPLRAWAETLAKAGLGHEDVFVRLGGKLSADACKSVVMEHGGKR